MNKPLLSLIILPPLLLMTSHSAASTPLNTAIWIGIVAAVAIAAQVIAIALTIAAQVIAIALIIQHLLRWRATVAAAVTIVAVAVEATLACRVATGGWL